MIMENTSFQPNIPHPGEFYKHYKTKKLYQIVTTATYIETGEPLVIYQALCGNFQIFACPLEAFTKCTKNGIKHFYRIAPETIHTDPDINVNMDINTNINTAPDISDISCVHDHDSGCNNPSQKDINTLMEKFYDARTYDEKLDLLYVMKSQLNDTMLTNIAISLDIVAADGTIEERFQSIVSCLNTMKKYQITRLR